MIASEQLAERNIRHNEAHLKHIDELIGRAATGSDSPEFKEELTKLKKTHVEFADYINELRRKSPERFMEQGGPMVMWELIAEKLGELIQRVEK